MHLKIQKLDTRAILPTRATAGSAGLDLCALLESPLCLSPGERALISTGIAVGLPADTVGLVFARSGLAVKHGVSLSNGVGVIDSDYTGELRVGLVNLGDSPYVLTPGERVAQLVVMPVDIPVLQEVTLLETTERGDSGFGSTGKT